MSCTGPSCMSSTMRCSSRSLVASRRRDAARASASWGGWGDGGGGGGGGGAGGSGGMRALHHVGFHREILRQPEPIRPRRRLDVTCFHPLPELPVVVRAGERRGVLLRLMLEDREDLGAQLVLR